MSLKLGKILKCVLSRKPDQTITIEQKFQVGIYHEKFQLDQILTCGHFWSTNFLVNAIDSTIFY